MKLIPCDCGAAPAMTERQHGPTAIVQVKCECGRHGAAMLFTRREDADKMKQAAADGWNLRL